MSREGTLPLRTAALALVLLAVSGVPVAAHAAVGADERPAIASNGTGATTNESVGASTTASATTTPTAEPTPAPTATPTVESTSAPEASASPESTSTPTPTPATPTAEPTTTAAETAPDADAGDPTFVVTNVSAPRELRLGGALVLTATVTNDGAVDGTERVNYSFGGATVASKSVSLDAGASTEVRFRATSADLEAARGPIAVGTYVHGVRNDSGSGIARRVRVTPDVDFAMNSFDAPTDVSRDEPYVVLATVENPGNVTITRDVTYRFESQVVAERAVTVAAGEERQVAFEVAIDGIESVVGPIRNDTTYHHAVRTTGGSGQGGAVRVVHGPSADASALAVEEFEATDDVGPGETVRVDVTVRNVASNDFEGQLSYRLDDSVVATEWTRVPIGERRTVSFRVDYAAIERAAVPLSARDTTHGVWVGDDAIRTRPVTVRAPVEGAGSATPAATFSPAPAPSSVASDDRTDGSADGGTAAADGSTCARGLVTKCGGTVVSEFTLTMIGIVTSVLGIVVELTRGN